MSSDRFIASVIDAWRRLLAGEGGVPPGLAGRPAGAVVETNVVEAGAIDAVAQGWLGVALAHHQFATVDEAALRAIAAELLTTEARTPGTGLPQVWSRMEALAQTLTGPAVTCGTYAAATQLDVLGLEQGLLVRRGGPVLDIGCGREAVLVRALRVAGLAVTGFDRVVDEAARQDGAVIDDWHAFAYGTKTWRDVVAHLSFSLHFAHHHAHRHPDAVQYARSYRAILDGVTDGGRFTYAPGLPFVERALPRGFTVVRRQLPASLHDTFEPVSRLAGEDIGYVAEITRHQMR